MWILDDIIVIGIHHKNDFDCIKNSREYIEIIWTMPFKKGQNIVSKCRKKHVHIYRKKNREEEDRNTNRVRLI